MKNRIQLGVIFALIIIVFALIFSQNANPDNPTLFGLKRVQEKAFLSLKTTPESKVDYLSNLLDIRLQEIKNLISNGAYSPLWSASLRYSTTAGEITELIVANSLNEKVESIRNKFLNHKKILDEMYVAYPKNTDNVEYKYIADDINYLKIYLDKLTQVK